MNLVVPCRIWIVQKVTQKKQKQPVEGKKQRVKKQKPVAADGEKKKRPLSAFMKFSQEKRAEVKSANPDITFGEVGRKLGEMWRALSEEQKATYKTAVAA